MDITLKDLADVYEKKGLSKEREELLSRHSSDSYAEPAKRHEVQKFISDNEKDLNKFVSTIVRNSFFMRGLIRGLLLDVDSTTINRVLQEKLSNKYNFQDIYSNNSQKENTEFIAKLIANINK